MRGSDRSRRRRLRLRRQAALGVALTVLLSCKNIENYAPELVAITGVIAEVAALHYAPDYALEVTTLLAVVTPAAVSMASTWAEERRRTKELARLEQIEAEIEAEQAELAKQTVQPDEATGSPTWGHASESSEGDGWTTASASSQVPAPQAAPSPDDGSPWGDRYTSKTGPETVTRGLGEGPLQLRVALLAVDEGPGPGTAIEDGHVLHDGRHGGDADRLRVFASPSADAWVYVIAVDAVGRVQPLYPSTFSQRPPPVRAGQPLLLPGGSDSYGLDEYRGLQHVFFVASQEPRPDLEQRLAAFAAAPLPEPRGGDVSVRVPTILESEQIRTRGLTGVRPVETVQIPWEQGEIDEISAQLATAPPGADLVVTRFFVHR
jgi:hypothetical protein